MFIGVYQSLAILAIVIAYYLMDVSLITWFDKKRTAKGSGRNWRYTILIGSLVVVMIAQPVVLPWLGWHTEAAWGLVLQLIGLALNVAALGLQIWSRIHLRQFYAERVELQPGHVIVDTGPYALVRHPVFSSFFLHVIGLVLLNPSLPTLVLAVYAFWDFSRAATKEEVLLSKNIPGYSDYMTRTAKFFPRLFGR